MIWLNANLIASKRENTTVVAETSSELTPATDLLDSNIPKEIHPFGHARGILFTKSQLALIRLSLSGGQQPAKDFFVKSDEHCVISAKYYHFW